MPSCGVKNQMNVSTHIDHTQLIIVHEETNYLVTKRKLRRIISHEKNNFSCCSNIYKEWLQMIWAILTNKPM
jgi:hypothetical protein